ncbi:tetratricopeptide repeat protein [Dyella sp.]|jgi:predicted TPR repeat methyltransferase|uniref:tetratricopeptide repeat protein n=1 Tax=Dyella sp. TaxID=1869338 RepID=UPI002D7938BF|nr:tetratricopeptide repeat protein [Dyella sp.]HET6433613.1 tetratricopeptide repeat protein [Dyella sp.]
MNAAARTFRRSRKAAKPASKPHAALLARAIQAHQAGDLDGAERLYNEVLEMHVAQPDALHFLGVLCHQRGRSDEAVSLIGSALKITPRHPDAHNNLGNIHKECGRLAEAEACYRRALECGPGHYNALSNLAVVLEAQERLDDAFDAYTRLLQQAPAYAHGHYRLGLFLRNHAQNEEHLEQSAECFREAFRCDERNVRALEGVGIALYMLGRHDAAAEVYRDWLVREPDNPVPRHMLASCGATEAPPRAADDYVRDVFDGFADSFDEQLLNNLGYRAPEVLMAFLDEVAPTAPASADVLDAGCGTGLCAPLLRERARHLVGVDLSGGMVDKARARGGYDALEVAELTAWLDAHHGAFDLVVSADTLVYFGELGPVLGAAAGALRPDGWLGFTLEAIEGDEDRSELSSSGRYRHSRAYVERVLTAAGFDAVTIRSDTLRREAGKPVLGWVVRARRASTPVAG